MIEEEEEGDGQGEEKCESNGVDDVGSADVDEDVDVK